VSSVTSEACTGVGAPIYAYISASWHSTHCTIDATYYAAPGDYPPYAKCVSTTDLGDRYHCYTNKTYTACEHWETTANPTVTVSYPDCQAQSVRWHQVLYGDL